jgi:hypothetical protein
MTMSISMLRLLSLSASLSLVACATEDSGEPITAQESALASSAMEGMVMTMAPASGGTVVSIAASYRATFGTGGLSCATVATDDVSYVTVSFACQGLFATTGSLRVELESPTKLKATADLTIGDVSIDGSAELTVPTNPSAERTLEASFSIDGPRRALSAEAEASWTASGKCVTYSSSGSVDAEGPRGSASGSFEVNARTVCRP